MPGESAAFALPLSTRLATRDRSPYCRAYLDHISSALGGCITLVAMRSTMAADMGEARVLDCP